jgi:hypothetical protein
VSIHTTALAPTRLTASTPQHAASLLPLPYLMSRLQVKFSTPHLSNTHLTQDQAFRFNCPGQNKISHLQRTRLSHSGRPHLCRTQSTLRARKVDLRDICRAFRPIPDQLHHVQDLPNRNRRADSHTYQRYKPNLPSRTVLSDDRKIKVASANARALFSQHNDIDVAIKRVKRTQVEASLGRR